MAVPRSEFNGMSDDRAERKPDQPSPVFYAVYASALAKTATEHADLGLLVQAQQLARKAKKTRKGRVALEQLSFPF